VDPRAVTSPTVADKIRDGVTHRWTQQQNRTHGARGALALVGNALRHRFQPLPSLSHQELSRAGAIGREIVNEFLGTTKPGPHEALKEELMPSQRVRDNTMNGRPNFDTVWNDAPFRICLGACGQDHEVSRLTALIRVQHDDRGAPLRAEVERSSGRPDFDDYCLGAISLKLEVPLMPGEPVPELSLWKFDQIVYRWSRAERILDPAFKPPGRQDNERSDILGDASVTAEIALVGAIYRGASSHPGVLK
jgi:hypothetical protein